MLMVMGRKSVIETHPQYEQIVEDILAGEMSQRDIALRYGVSQSAVSAYSRRLPVRMEQLPTVKSTVERTKRTLEERREHLLELIEAHLEANKDGPPQIYTNILELYRKTAMQIEDLERRTNGSSPTTVNIYQQNNMISLDTVANYLRGKADDRAAIIGVLEAAASTGAESPALPPESRSLGTRAAGD